MAHPTYTSAQLASLRELLKANNLSAFFIPTEDAHQSEYIADCDKRREFISGFTGSAGSAVVSMTEAALFTDGRYFLQASQQLDQNWLLMKQAEASGLKKTLPQGSSLVPVENLVDQVWGSKRPARPTNPVTIQETKYAGKSHTEKLSDLRNSLQEKGVYGTVVSALDEIAWLFNLRGSDIECNPVFFSYALVTKDTTTLYVDEAKLSPAVKQHLGSEIAVKPYEQVFEDLRQTRSALEAHKQKLLITPRTSLALQIAVGADNTEEGRSLITDAKAVKNQVELEGMRQCQLRDGAALIKYFAWLENQLKNGAKLSEVQATDKLEKFRKEQEDFVGLSFDTISSTGANGAIIHYKPEPETCKIIDINEIYLCDSGAQFKDGTTDTTRTYHFGTPTAYQKRCFTRVLQGHIAIDEAVFPNGVTGYLLDPWARKALWEDGLDFRHGTGHGVGAFLNVHEGPHGIGTRIAYNDTPLQAGMVVTNEPGYYEDGAFGIRIENILLVQEVKTPNNFGNRGYLGFEHVTLVPIGLNLIDRELLTPREKAWINRYHVKVAETIAPLLEDDDLALQWLKRETTAI
ncbi:hypothetical protein BZG36_04169 [Bifiguratus adelaidae]|uniref:Xaa-Pro aminopeptidase P n=1 Tax=Bifiguratus adelaidae TaxID=1938954 RepID=A0A261XYV2_9FUNG|nr:hypothetical protein BZG36_04169 [Bifiguratus adelaidae]